MVESSRDIDFVIPWVDGDDPEWQEAFKEWSACGEGDKRVLRFRDWGNLKYLFRGIERFTPWVRHVHFVTMGHLPAWLNVGHPQLKIVRHSDFLDQKNLPVFNCNPFEVNLHKIPGLAEQFVYLNDDCFFLKDLTEERFFKKGLPRDLLVFDIIAKSKIAHIKFNDVEIINRFFNKRVFSYKNLGKILNLKYGLMHNFRNLSLLPWKLFPGFVDPHMPQPFLKKTFLEVWEACPEVLEQTSMSRFRSSSDVNQYLFRYWQLCKGEFLPVGFEDTYSKLVFNLEDAERVKDRLQSRRFVMAAINDEFVQKADWPRARDTINLALEEVLPERSHFERIG